MASSRRIFRLNHMAESPISIRLTWQKTASLFDVDSLCRPMLHIAVILEIFTFTSTLSFELRCRVREFW